MSVRVAACAALLTLPAHAVDIVCLGDSITEGVGLPNVTTPWPSVIDASLGIGFNTTNAGISGDTTATMRARYCATCVAVAPDIVVFAIGTNDVQSDLSAATIYARASEMFDDACRRGFDVIVIDVMPRAFSGARESVRDSLNVLYQTWTVSGHPSQCTAHFVDMSAILDVDDNGTFDAAFQNGIEFTHPDQDGMNAIAEAVALVVSP